MIRIKDCTTSEIKDYYDNKDFDSNDVYDISKGTTKEDELFYYTTIMQTCVRKYVI